MHSPTDRAAPSRQPWACARAAGLALACWLTPHATLLAQPASASPPQAAAPAPAAPAPTMAATPATPAQSAQLATPAQVRQAVETTREDPALGGTVKQRIRQWKKTTAEKTQPPFPRHGQDQNTPSEWDKLLSAIASGGRLFVWVLGAILVAVAAVMLRHWVRLRADAAPARRVRLPSHVRHLDIRPESLPDDVGLAARQRWLAGQHREALSLLYRGALSRLVHGHAVPIMAASTEGECVRLAERALGHTPSRYFADLVSVWQTAVYANHMPESPAVLALCDGFERALPHRTAPPAEVAA